jgi:TonB-linked SusC/RagA family outer membrane protein
MPALLVAQGVGTIEGTVIDAGSKRPLGGVQVNIIGTLTGGISNPAGVFRIVNVAAGARQVRARVIGYGAVVKTVNVVDGQAARVTFELSQAALELSAVVTTGTGGSQVEARKLGTTVASISAPQSAPITSFSDVLGGREPGVQLLPSSGVAGEGARIRIRGNASLSQSNEPIVYIDGVRIDNGGGFGNGYVGTGGGGRPSRLDDIDPGSIEKVEILKGASAATLYGTEASNGVILITTKKGSTSAPKWGLDLEQGATTFPTDRMEDQWGIARSDTQATRLAAHFGKPVTAFTPFSEAAAKTMFQTGSSSEVNGQVSGGTPIVTYFASVRGYLEDGAFTAKNVDWQNRGTFMKNVNNKYQGTLNLGVSPSRNFKIQASMLYATTHLEIPENNNSIYAPYTVALFSKPENAQCNASATTGTGLCTGAGNPQGNSTFGTVRELVQFAIKQDARHFNGRMRGSYIPSANLNFDLTAGVDFTAQRSTSFLPFGNSIDGRTGRQPDGLANVDDRTHQEITGSINGGWTRDLGKHFNSNLLFGAQGFLTRDNDESSNNVNFPGPGIEVIGGGSSPQVFESFSSIVNAGFFAQEQLGFNDWMFGTAGGRYDYNSAFGKTSGGVFYPQGSLSIIPSDIPAYKDTRLAKVFQTMRFRAALGKAGRQPGAFDKLTTYGPLTSPLGGGLVPNNLGNPNLRPEISTEWEAGAEVGIMDGRTSIEISRWQRQLKDALISKQFPVSGGFSRLQLANIGSMQSWGWDLKVKSFLVNKPGLSADVYGNIGFLTQIVTSLGGAPPLKVGGSYPRYRNYIIEGYAPGTMFSAALPQPCAAGATKGPFGGRCIPAGSTPWDTNGDGVPDTEAQMLAFLASPRALTAVNPMQNDDNKLRSVLGNYGNYAGKPLPDFQGSFGGSVTFRKNWRVSTNLEYKFGNFTISDLTDAFRQASPTNGGNNKLNATVQGILLNPASTAQQRLDAAKTYVNELVALSPYDGMNQSKKGDFLRWRELSLTYTAPTTWANKIGGTDLTISASGRNLMMFTKYTGVDPEVNLLGRGGGGGTDQNFGESIDAFGFPLPRRFAINVKVGF